MRERVRERVLEIWIEPGLVNELGGLQVFESTAEHFLWQIGDRLKESDRHVSADNGGDLEQSLIFRCEPVDTRCEHRLDRGRDLDRLDWLRQPIPSWLASQRLCLHQRPDGLL